MSDDPFYSNLLFSAFQYDRKDALVFRVSLAAVGDGLKGERGSSERASFVPRLMSPNLGFRRKLRRGPFGNKTTLWSDIFRLNTLCYKRKTTSFWLNWEHARKMAADALLRNCDKWLWKVYCGMGPSLEQGSVARIGLWINRKNTFLQTKILWSKPHSERYSPIMNTEIWTICHVDNF